MRRTRFQNCEYANKRVAIEFDEEILENGGGQDLVFENPVKCSISKCPNMEKCVYMQEKRHWK